MSAEWKAIVDFADRFADDRNATPPSPAVIGRAFEGYWKAIEFENCELRWNYLAALGLKAAP